jgi:hypothetical protein
MGCRTVTTSRRRRHRLDPSRPRARGADGQLRMVTSGRPCSLDLGWAPQRFHKETPSCRPSDQPNSPQLRLGASSTRQLRNFRPGFRCWWPLLPARRIHPLTDDNGPLCSKDHLAFGVLLSLPSRPSSGRNRASAQNCRHSLSIPAIHG